MASNRKKSRFGVGLLIYIFLFLILSVIALIFFYDWLKAYEETRPYNSVNAYTETLAVNGPGNAALASLAEVDRSLQSEEEIKAFVADILSRTEFVRSSALSTPEKLVYSARADGRSIGTVSFEPTEEKRLGFRFWALASEDYDFSSYLNNSTFVIPEDYQASVNGTILSRQNITSDDTPYSSLSAYYDSFPSLPHLVTYTSGKYLGQAEEAVIDRHGKSVSQADMTETVFLDTCTPSDRDRLSAFVRKFAATYVQFTADVNGSYYYYYSELRQMVSDSSPLVDRMSQALGSFGFTTTKSCDIIDDSVNFCLPMDATHYLIDYSYTTKTVGRAEAVEDSRNIRLVVSDQNGKLLVDSMNYY